jgi:hypothetical protein
MVDQDVTRYGFDIDLRLPRYDDFVPFTNKLHRDLLQKILYFYPAILAE